VCANGQCITVTSNAIAGNLAAFGVTVADVNTFLMPLVLLLLFYSLYSIFYSQKEDLEPEKDIETGKPTTNSLKKSFISRILYKPFLIASTGASLIVLDNFYLLQHGYVTYSVFSYVGNALFIGSAIYASKDKQTKE